MRTFYLLLLTLSCSVLLAQDPHPRLSFTQTDGQIAINVDDQAIASYVYQDKQIPRPYFAHVKAPGGIQVTRNHPPQAGSDRTDHAAMHPGIWLAFGDLDSSDFWRNKATVKHVKFIQEPAWERNMGSFIEQKQYLRADNSAVCSEVFRFAVLADRDAYLFVLQSTFRSDHEFFFGDQEEMGLAVRVATPISEVGGGELTDSAGRSGAKQIWSQPAAWCDYSGQIDGQRVGITVMAHPQNFRESWWHARDYGLLAANPFGRQAMKKGPRSKVIVKPGETLTLRYAAWIHAGAAMDKSAIEAVYRQYQRLGPK